MTPRKIKYINQRNNLKKLLTQSKQGQAKEKCVEVILLRMAEMGEKYG